MTPLLLLLIIPFAYGVYGVKKAKLRSPIHFQQGTLGASPWRAAISMCLISLPFFTIWGLLISSASALFYLLGAFSALFLVIFTSSTILHYIPSPSIYTYTSLRYHSKPLRSVLALMQFLLSVAISLLCLQTVSTSLSALTALPAITIAPLVAFSCLFSVIFSGQSNILSPIFIITLGIVFCGLGLFLYFSVEDVQSLQDLLPVRFSPLPSVFSFFIGFMLTMYQLVASPAMYQLYFSLSTRHKLRLCFILYGVFLLISAAFVFLLSSLFADFLRRHCQLAYSFSSLFQFMKFTMHPHTTLTYAVASVFLLLPLLILQSLLLSTTGHVWEEFARQRFVEFSSGKQLATVQVITFLISVILTVMAILIEYLQIPFHLVLPISFYALSCTCCILAASFILGHYIPFSNSKGNFAAAGFSTLLLVALLCLHLSRNDLPQLEAACDHGPHRWEWQRSLPTTPAYNSTPLPFAGHLFSRAAFTVARLPLYTHSFILTMAYFFVCAIVSWMTGGEDLFVLDWNLVVYVCAPFSPAINRRRGFVECESFRYAQQKGAAVRYPTDRRILYA